MADGNVIDTLSIEISANADKAAKGLDQLSARLRSLSASVKNLSGTAQTLNVLSNSFQRLGSVNVGNISKAIDQLERLSRLDLKDKQIKMEVTLTGASEAERQMHAVQHAMIKIDPAEFSRKLAKAFQIDDKNAIANLEKEFRHILTSYSSGDLQINNSELFKPIIQNGHVMKSEFDSDIRSMQSRYKEFLDYVNSSKFHVASDTWKSVARTYAQDNEVANKGALSIFTTQKAARDLNGMWEQLTDYTDGYGDVFDRLLGDTKDGFAQMAKYITDDTQQMEALIEVVQKAREALKSVPVKGLDQEQRTQALKGTVTQGVKDMLSAYNAEVNQYMKDSTNKVPIDVIVDAAVIEKRIDSAIRQAAKKEYELPLKFSIPTKDIKSQLTNILSGLKLNDIQNVAVPIQDMSRALYDLGNINIRDNGTGAFINNIRKLSEVKIDPSTPTHIASIANSLGGFAKIGNISSNITRFISALARLASAGKSIQDVTTELPNFATAIQKVATTLSQLGGVNPLITQFISALGQLASSAQKMPDAAKNLELLSESLKKMIESLSKTSVSQDIVNMVASISQLSTALGSINQGTAQSVGSSTQKMGKSIKFLVNIIDKVLNKIGTLFKRIGSGIANVSKKVISNITGMNKASKSMFTVSDGIKSVMGGLLGMRGLTGVFNWTKEAITAGGDITEINHIIESVFEEDMVDAVDTWATEAIEKFGIASGAAKHYAGVLSSMFQASGVSMREAGEMGMRLTEMAGDLSAFYNIDTETAYQKIQSGMAGMVRPLRSLGIDLSVASLQEYALSQGITKKVSAMAQAEKVMLRYHYLLQATSQATGDFARTSDSFANVLRTVRAYASAVSTQIGVGLAAALRHVLILLRSVLKAALRLAQGFAKVMESIFGKYTGSASALDTGLIDSEDYADDLADAVGDASGGLGDAADAAEKLQKELSVLPFDELNQLNKDREDTSSGTGGTGTGGDLSGLGDGLGDLGDAMTDLGDMIDNSLIPGKIQKWIDRIKEAFNDGDWKRLGEEIAGMLNEGIQGIYDMLDPKKVMEKVEPFIEAFTTTFNSLVDNLNFDLIGRTIARGINDIAYIFNSWYEKMHFEQLGVQLSNGLNGLLTEGDFYAWGLALGNKFMIGWDIFKGFVSNEQMWHNLGLAIADGIKGLTAGIRLGDIGIALSNFINGICETLETLAEDDEMWSGVVDNLVDGVNKFIGNMEWKDNGQKLNKFLQSLADALSETIDSIHWEDLGKGLGQTLTEIKLGSALKKLAGSIVKALAGFLKGFLSEDGGVMATSIIAGFGALKLATGLAKSTIGTEIIKGIAKSITNSGSKKLLADAIGEAATGSTGASGAAAADAALGSSIAGGALLTGLVIAAKNVSQFVDAARGGNGVISAFGTAVDGLTSSLSGSNKITKEQADELFRLKENGEETGQSQEQIASMIISKLGEYGITADSAKASIDGLAASGRYEADAMETLSQAASDASANTDGLSSSQLLLNGQSLTTQQAIKDLKGALYDAKLETGEFAGEYDLAREALSNTSDIHSAEEAYKIIINSMGEGSKAADSFKAYLSSLGYSFEETEKKAEKSGANIAPSMANGIGNFSSITGKINEIRNAFATTFENIRQSTVTSGKNTSSEYGNAYANRSQLATNLAATTQQIASAFGNIQNVSETIGNNTIMGYGRQFANRSELNNNLNATKSEVTTIFEAIQKAAETIGTGAKQGVIHGLQKHADGLKEASNQILTTAQTTADGVRSALDLSGDMYSLGSSAGNAFASGFSGVHIPMPHIMFDFLDIGLGMQIPIPTISWYKAGGLFKGGNGQLIGIGEDNRDEAVLPLENRKAMSAIAESIVGASNGGLGLSADDIADAVVQAFVMTQSNQPDPIIHVEVKTENDEVLARAVTRGQQSIDYRNNPTPKLAY